MNESSLSYEAIASRLEERGVKPTPNRIIVLREIISEGRPVCLVDLESKLDTLDRSSIFRVLTLLAEADILHAIEDGSGSMKYELCQGSHGHSTADMHCHFHCTECGATFCLEEIKVPDLALPEGFTARSVNHLIKGLCPDCSKKQSSQSRP